MTLELPIKSLDLIYPNGGPLSAVLIPLRGDELKKVQGLKFVTGGGYCCIAIKGDEELQITQSGVTAFRDATKLNHADDLAKQLGFKSWNDFFLDQFNNLFQYTGPGMYYPSRWDGSVVYF